MEPEALAIIEEELDDRGVSPQLIADHATLRRQTMICHADGTAVPCSFCDRPAVIQAWGWHRLWSLVPLFPRFYSYCEEHRQAPQPYNEEAI